MTVAGRERGGEGEGDPFSSSLQGGSHVEVLSAQGHHPVAQWRLSGSVSRRYDKTVRGYIHQMEGDSTSTKMQLPGSDKTSCT